MNRPHAPEHLVRALLSRAHLPTPSEPCAILGVRGYFRDTMGEPGRNDAGIYDDAMFFIAPGVFVAVNANTDPSHLGWNASLGKPFAMLRAGLHYFIRGPHKGRMPALRQATEDEAQDFGIPNHGHFPVWRGKDIAEVIAGTARLDEGYHAINIHRGGETTTSSWGCQTIPPGQFDHFMLEVHDHTHRARQDRIPYLLIDGPIT